MLTAQKAPIEVNVRDPTPPDSSDAANDTTLQDQLNDLIRQTVDRETSSFRRVMKCILDRRDQADVEHREREKDQLSQLDDARKQIARFQAVPFPLNLMHCNKCAGPFSDNEAIHVADDCGAVSRKS
jgi:hypothetical protein